MSLSYILCLCFPSTPQILSALLRFQRIKVYPAKDTVRAIRFQTVEAQIFLSFLSQEPLLPIDVMGIERLMSCVRCLEI